MKKRKTKLIIIIAGVLVTSGVVFGLNGYFGGGATIPSDTMSRGLVGYWNLDEATGTTAYDSSGNGNNGTLGGGTAAYRPQWAANGKVSGALQFDGVNDYVNVADNNSLDIVNTITIEAWVKRNTVGTTGVILNKQGVGTELSYSLWISGNILAFYLSTNGTSWGGQISSNSSLSSTVTWYHVVGIFDGTQLKLYLNGASDAIPVAWNNSIYSSISPVRVGSDTISTHFNGLIDDVRIYNRALSPEEIRYHYNRGGPVGYWKFDEGSGTTAYDSTDNNNDGTLGGGTEAYRPTWTTGKNGTALAFDGVNDYVDAGNGASLNITDKITMSAWIKGNSFSGNPFVLDKSYNTSYYLQLLSTGVVEAGINAAKLIQTATGAVNIGNWNYITFTYDSGGGDNNTKIYVNGIISKQDTKTGAATGNTNSLIIGALNAKTSNWFNGLIDDVRIYNYARTADEIRLDYNAGFAARFGQTGKSCSDDPGSCMTKGLAGYWSMDEGTGQTAYDISGNSNNGTLGANSATSTDDPAWSQNGKVGGTLAFDGVNDYINIGNPASLNIQAAITIEAWIYRSVTPAGIGKEIIGKNYTSGYTLVAWSDGSWALDINANATYDLSLTSAPSLSTWHHFVGTYDSSLSSNQMKVYLDGVLNNQRNNTGSIINSGNVYVGGGQANRYFPGLIDEVRIYNRALSTEEIRYHYNRGGPVGYWKFDEGSGQTAYDSSGNSNTGTLYGGLATSTTASSGWKTGKYGTALAFDGVDDYVDAGTGASLNFVNAITLESWINVAAIGNNIVVNKYSDNEGWDLQISSSYTNRVRFGVHVTGGNTDIVTVNAVSLNTWHHVVATYDGTNYAMYIDGVSQSYTGTTYTGTIKLNNYWVGIGRRQVHAAYVFNGLIDDVRIYNYARTPDEIALDYNAGFAARFGQTGKNCSDDPGSCMTKGLAGYWSMDEGTGQTAYDISGNSNNGTLTNSPAWTSQGKVNGALRFDGVDDYVDVGSNLNPDAITVEAWVNVISWPNQHTVIVGNFRNVNEGGYLLGHYYGLNVFKITNGAGMDYEAELSIPTGAWTHLVGTFDGTTISTYTNGVFQGSTNITGYTKSPYSTTIGVRAGWYNTFWFNGSIDDVRIYNRALSAEEIRYHYNRGGPVGYWSFDEGSGSVAYDATENNNDGTLYGGMATSTVASSGWKPGKYGSALAFDGVDDYVSVPDSNILDITSAITISAWVKADTLTSTGDTIAMKQSVYGLAVNSNGNIRFDLDVGAGFVAHDSNNNEVTTGQWYYLAGTYDGNRWIIYKNSARVKSGDLTGSIQTSGNALKIGEETSSYNWDGLIDDVRIYNYARTQDQILQDYNGGLNTHFK